MTDTTIVKAAIYPALGVARVGNAPGAQDYFFGPEMPGPHPQDPDDFRDEQMRIKRQAQRFRVYGLNAAGEVVRELVSDEDTDIKWTVEVANKKASWYQFSQALDIPASSGDVPGTSAVVNKLRNETVTDRASLAITPGPCTISGCNTNQDGTDSSYAFDDGQFFGVEVYLGELRTDEAGRLIFLGGRGHTAPAPGHEDAPLPGFGNNPWWHDDTSDGPVTAAVTIGGQSIPTDNAWVLTAPPNYAPGIPASVTGYEFMLDVAVGMDPGLAPGKPSFWRDIYPILEHSPAQEWVNAGFARDFGWGSPMDFRDPALIARLNSTDEAERALRTSIFNRFRDADYPFMQTNAWPAYYGDAMTANADTQDPREWMAIPPLQYGWLRQWAEGDFIADAQPVPPANFYEQSPAGQAEGMTYAALHETLGGPFHPGCEFTWPMRHASMYVAPFRIKQRYGSPLDYGPTLDAASVMQKDGPLDGNGPGDVTRWMACPWQTDTASCLSAYNQFSGEYQPTFWPARVPNDVMTQDQFQTLTDPDSTPAQKADAFNPLYRPKWLREIDYTNDIPAQSIKTPPGRYTFTHHWWEVAILLPKPTNLEDPAYPDQVWVETGRTFEPVVRAESSEEMEVTPRAIWSGDPSIT